MQIAYNFNNVWILSGTVMDTLCSGSWTPDDIKFISEQTERAAYSQRTSKIMQSVRVYAKVTLSMEYAALPQQQAFPRGSFYTLERTEQQMLLICSASKTVTQKLYTYIDLDRYREGIWLSSNHSQSPSLPCRFHSLVVEIKMEAKKGKASSP